MRQLPVVNDTVEGVDPGLAEGRLVAMLTQLTVVRKADQRIFTIPFVRTEPFHIGEAALVAGVLELSIDPLQLVKIRVHGGSGQAIGSSQIDIVESESSFSARTTADGELWLLLVPGTYLVSESASGVEVSLKIDRPEPAERSVDLVIPQ